MIIRQQNMLLNPDMSSIFRHFDTNNLLREVQIKKKNIL